MSWGGWLVDGVLLACRWFSLQGKHAKVEWILQPEHLQARARQWIEQNCPKKGDPPRKESIINMFRDFCNNDLLLEVQVPSWVP